MIKAPICCQIDKSGTKESRANMLTNKMANMQMMRGSQYRIWRLVFNLLILGFC